MRPILFGSSPLLVAVGLVNLLTTLLLVTRERARDFGILKAIGLTPRGVLGVVNSGGAALGAIAIVIGIPVGIVLFRELMRAMSPSEGTDIVGPPGPFALALIVPFVLAVTALRARSRLAGGQRERGGRRSEPNELSASGRRARSSEPERRMPIDAADDPGDPAGLGRGERHQDQDGGDRQHAQQVAVVLAAVPAAEHVAHRPGREHAQRAAVGAARDALVEELDGHVRAAARGDQEDEQRRPPAVAALEQPPEQRDRTHRDRLIAGRRVGERRRERAPRAPRSRRRT